MVGAIVLGALAGLALGRGSGTPVGGHVTMPVSSVLQFSLIVGFEISLIGTPA
jgi:chromate transporter